MTCVRSSRCDAMPTVGKFLVFVCCKSRPIKKPAVYHLWTEIIVFTFWGQLQYIFKRNLGIQRRREVLVVTGGYSWNSILARTESLNMTAEEGNRWRRLAPLLKPRYLHACSPVQLGAEVYLPHSIPRCSWNSLGIQYPHQRSEFWWQAVTPPLTSIPRKSTGLSRW